MKLKITLIAVFGTLCSISVQAQTSDAEAEAMVNLLGVQKREAVSKLVPVSGKDSIAFWKIYDEYQQSNKSTIKSRIQLYERTAQAYSNMTPAIADSLSLKYFANRVEQEKSLETYYKKIKAATNAVVAFEFYQAETYLLTQLRASIMQQIPTYGELVRASKKQ
ncbi:hypothetical protein C3K47_11120 [Solitalea longa]|uniref:Uncharacterized protein n=1 Tax=Solitalea longa TaxID=2079460 RepID=A0A2S5A130_9SPHI|nr:hypothetical protein [Solitalea longa]POY36298.1 hypothetical protein C3K47_11120 [Solitalea longa]